MADVIRIGAFFDGTGNNMWNDLAIGDGSQTNIAKIYKMYNDQGYITKYVEGVGTEGYTETHTFVGEIDKDTGKDKIEEIKQGKSRNDFYSSYNMAFGDEAKSKVTRMLEMVKNEIKKHPDAQIIVDVYGFSRGATSARDFINMFNAQYADVNNGSAIGFVGLFDTVATVGFANEYNYNLNLNLSTYSAQQMVHLTANDEFRANFPLQSFNNQHSKLRIAA